ncbi:hypothetical protein BOX15_Mlig003290g1, partial [Macrostomum lignano]
LCHYNLSMHHSGASQPSVAVNGQAFRPPRRQSSRIECLVGAQRVQQAAERLLLCSKMWPPPPPTLPMPMSDTGQAVSPSRVEPSDHRARRELANLRLLVEEARRGGRTMLAAAPNDGEDMDAADFARRLQMSCVGFIESVYRSVYSLISQQQPQSLSEDHQQQQLNRLAVARACDGLLASALGLELSLALSSGSGPDDRQLERLAEQLGQSLAELSKAGRPARLGGDPADMEALQLAVRCASAAVAQLLHAVRCVRAALASLGAGGHPKEDPAAALEELRSRVHLAVENLRPAVATVLAVSGESRFSGRPFRLTDEAKNGRARALGHALPVALCTAELLTAMAGATEQQASPAQQQRQRLNQLAESLNAACTDCLAKLLPGQPGAAALPVAGDGRLDRL